MDASRGIMSGTVDRFKKVSESMLSLLYFCNYHPFISKLLGNCLI